MKRALRRAIASLAPPVSDEGVRVLLYHSVDGPDGADRMGLRVSPEAFRAQMTMLRAERYQVVPLTSMLEPPSPDIWARRRRVAITFDDGYRSETSTAGILKEFGFTATFFVVPRFLDGVREPEHYWEGWPHMNWDEAARLLEEGFEIGAHSKTHPDLTTCDAGRLIDEVAGAKAVLQPRLGAPIVSFSYPYGRHNHDVREAARRAGYRLACTSCYGIHVAGAAAYAVARTEVTGMDTPADFRRKLQGKYDWLARWEKLTRRAHEQRP